MADTDLSAMPQPSDQSARRERIRAHAGMTLFAFFVGGSFVLGAHAAPLVDARALTALRFALAAGALTAVIGVLALGANRSRPHQFKALTVRSWRFLLLGGFYGGYFVAMFEALRFAEPISLAAIFTLTPLATMGLAYLLANQSISRALLVALLIGAVGAVWVVFRGDAARLLAFDLGLGEAIFFVGMLAHSAYAALVNRLKGDTPFLVFGLGVLIGAMLVTGASGFAALASLDWGGLPWIVWATVFYLAVCATTCTSLLIQYGAARLPASKVMAYTYLVPSSVLLLQILFESAPLNMAILPGVAATLFSLGLLAASRG